MKGTPQALLNALVDNGIVPDGIGEYGPLRAAEAQAIRATGYTAITGRMWRCPIFPASLVQFTMYAHLGDDQARAFGNDLGEWALWRSHIEGDRSSAYGDARKAVMSSYGKMPCPLCTRPGVRRQANAHAHVHIDNALGIVRKHLAAAAAAIGMQLTPIPPTHTR